MGTNRAMTISAILFVGLSLVLMAGENPTSQAPGPWIPRRVKWAGVAAGLAPAVSEPVEAPADQVKAAGREGAVPAGAAWDPWAGEA